MMFENLRVYQRPNNMAFFEVSIQMENKENLDTSFWRLYDLLKAHFGIVSYQDSRLFHMVFPPKKDGGLFPERESPRATKQGAGIRVKESTWKSFEKAIQERHGLEPAEARGVLKGLYGVDDLENASRSKSLEVLEKIAKGRLAA